MRPFLTARSQLAKRGPGAFLRYNPVDQGGKSAVTMTRGWRAAGRGALSESKKQREGKGGIHNEDRERGGDGADDPGELEGRRAI